MKRITVLFSFFIFAVSSLHAGNILTESPKNFIIIYQQGKTIKVEGTKSERNIQSEGDEVLHVKGSHNVVVVKGGLKSVMVKGMHNEVYVDRLEEVTIDGEHNKVSYKSIPDKKAVLKSTIVQGSKNNNVVKAK